MARRSVAVTGVMLLLLVSLSCRRGQSFSLHHAKTTRKHNRYNIFHYRRRPGTTAQISFATKAPSADEATAAAASSNHEESQQLMISEAPVILLKRSRQSKAFRNGNQLVFKRAVQKGTAPMCAFVRVAVAPEHNPNKKQQQQAAAMEIGWGVFNPNSLYKVRILCHRYLQPTLYQRITAGITGEQEMTTNQALLEIMKYHLQMACQKRRALNLPLPEINTMYRLVNGEGDALSGLQMDVIDQYLVVQSSAGWCEVHKQTILEAIQEVMPEFDADHIIWKVAPTRLKQDGHKLREEEEQTEADAEPVLALENGVMFQTFPTLKEGQQKTGVYCDQRENRRLLAQYTQGKTVLDLCCFHGGFSLTAVIQGGATRAVGVDSSAAAIAMAQTNAKLNHCENKVNYIQSDITQYMQQQAQNGGDNSFDVVVLDPPKLAPTVASLERARRKYHGFNRDAIKLVSAERGGIFMTCTCSAAMTQQDGGQYFTNMVAGAAQAAGRQVTLLSKSGAASCHTQSPVCWPAGAYLTAALFFVHPVVD